MKEYYHKRLTVAVDFDDTMADNHYPECGELYPHVKDVINNLQLKGVYFILWTARVGVELDAVKEMLIRNGIFITTVNHNCDHAPYRTRKIYADIFIDDRGILGLPLMKGKPDWCEIERIIEYVLVGGDHRYCKELIYEKQL